MTDVFHKAAKDGYLDLLREATRRDCNKHDEDGMTPTLWAAYYGNLDALRMIVGRGGDPDKCDHLGNTCLHHAAANGFMNVVSFLVSFGANLWALDNDYHTALDSAALANRNEIVKYLDSVYGRQQLTNKKIVKKLKEKAVLEAQRRVKKYHKLQKKARQKADKQDKKIKQEYDGVYGGDTQSVASYNGTLRNDTLSKFSTLSAPRSTFSEPKPYSHHFATINTRTTKPRTGAVARMINKKKQPGLHEFNQDFKIGERDMDGTRTIKSLSGLRRDNHVMYVRPTSNGKGSLSSSDSSTGSTFTMPLSRTISEPDFFFPGDSGIESSSSPDPEPGMFERPGFGNVAFINKHITSTALLSLGNDNDSTSEERLDNDPSPLRKSAKRHSMHDITDTASIGTIGTLAKRIEDLPWDQEDVDISDEETADPDDISLELFLAANSLSDFLSVFHREKIDLPALMLLTDRDLIDLGLPMGPRRKVIKAVDRRKKALEKPGIIMDSVL